MPIAFFDLDRTLISVNSGQLWVAFERREGRIRFSQAARAALWIFGYHLGFSRMEPILEEAIATLAGEEEEVLRERSLRFYRSEVERTFRPGALPAVQQHRAQGHRLALLTSSSIYLSEAVGQSLGISHLCCNEFQVQDGRFTGQPQRPLCFGAGKVIHAERLALQLGEKLEESWFYTDSYSDLPVLERVGHPVVVNPDPALAREARRRGWPLVDWGRSENS